MRCGCPECGAFMVQTEASLNPRCVCPDCGYSCTACLGTNTVIDRSVFTALRKQNGAQDDDLRPEKPD